MSLGLSVESKSMVLGLFRDRVYKWFDLAFAWFLAPVAYQAVCAVMPVDVAGAASFARMLDNLVAEQTMFDCGLSAGIRNDAF